MLAQPDVADAVSVEEVGTTAELERLAPAWAALWAEVPGATPFQSPHWLIPWWRHLGEGALLTLALRIGRTLVGLLPLYVHRETGIGRRRLFPIGIGTTDYLDALILPHCEAAAMTAAMDRLGAQASRFDHAEWPQLRETASLLAATAPGWADRREGADPCPVLELPDSVDALATRVSRKTLRDLRTARRRATDAGVAGWDVATEKTLPAAFDALLHLHAARWRRRDEPGVLADPAVQRMHRDALPLLLRAGLLRFLVLRSATGEAAAALYALVDPPGRARRCLYLYLSGFDPALERLSPGMLLVGQALDLAFAEGLHAVDFLRGRERYKSFWGAQETPTYRRVLTPPVAAMEEGRCAAC